MNGSLPAFAISYGNTFTDPGWLIVAKGFIWLVKVILMVKTNSGVVCLLNFEARRLNTHVVYILGKEHIFLIYEKKKESKHREGSS